MNAWTNRDTMSQIIRENGFEGPIDRFVRDGDGVDCWVCRAPEAIQPRAVNGEMEYHDPPGWNPERLLKLSDSRKEAPRWKNGRCSTQIDPVSG